MTEKYGPHEGAALLVLMLHGGEMPNAQLRKEHGVELTPAGRAKLNTAEVLVTSKVGARLFHKLTPKGERWCVDALAEIETPPRSNPLARVGFELLRRYAREDRIRLDGGGLDAQIRAAYRELAERARDWVRLAQLRPKLNGAGKSEVDETLLAMVKSGDAVLAPDSDRRGLTEADHAAAIRVGKEDKHFVSIEGS